MSDGTVSTADARAVREFAPYTFEESLGRWAQFIEEECEYAAERGPRCRVNLRVRDAVDIARHIRGVLRLLAIEARRP